MPGDNLIPENIQALLDRADLSLLWGKHGRRRLSSGMLPRRR